MPTWITRNYRDAYNIYACNGILFNHESPRRGETFVTRKITRALAAIKPVNRRNSTWAIWMPNAIGATPPNTWKPCGRCFNWTKQIDFVIGTGESHTVREFLQEAFSYAGMKYEDYVEIDPRYFRPTEVDYLLSDPSKAEQQFGWKPKVKFHELVRIMVDADLELQGLPCPGEGRSILQNNFGGWHRWENQVISME
jgi:GDPmannose 4,6-dehydratase